MLKRLRWAVQYGILAALFILLPPAHCEAQPHPPQGQSGVQSKEAAGQQAIQPSDSITLPDGTPLTLKLDNYLSSATANVGDTVEFSTAYSVRVNGLVIVPRGTAVHGTVVQVNHAHRPVKNAQVYVRVEKLVLPNGELLTFGPRQPRSEKMKNVGQGDALPPAWAWTLAPFDPAAWIVVPMMPFVKGQEQVYPAGTQTTVYLNGSLSLNRSALLKLQRPPYKGPAQVFFVNRRVLLFDKSAGVDYQLFCGQKFILRTPGHLVLDLNPGTYVFSTGKKKEHAVQLEVHEDNQYWVERERGGLFEKDLQQHLNDIEDFGTPKTMGYTHYSDRISSECPVIQPQSPR